jgi:chromosome segregation ATPase
MTEKMTEDELRTLTDEYDQYQLVDKLVAAYREQTTTLDRVRADNSELVTMLRRGLHVRMHANGLADWAQMAQAYLATPRDTALAGQPEAPKGQEAKPLPAREHARRRGSLDGADAQALEGALSQVERGLAAANAEIIKLKRLLATRVEADRLSEANARIAELEDKLQMADCAEIAANARADAAEREAERWEVCAKDLHAERNQLAQKLEATEREANAAFCIEVQLRQKAEAERHQLAARVKELESTIEAMNRANLDYLKRGQADSFCTPGERKVLEACKAIHAGDWEELRDGAFVNQPERDLAVAELANRAAKAKREAK